MSEEQTQIEEAPEAQIEQITTDAPEVEESPPESPLAAEIAAARAEILGEPEPEIEEEPEPDPEPDNSQELLAAEKRAREEQTALKTEREAFAEEQKETLEKVEAYNKSLEDLQFDPLEHLVSAGLTDEQQQDLAREIILKFMPDTATPETKAQLASVKSERRLRKLEKQLAAKNAPKAEKKPETPQQPSQEEYEAYETEYYGSLETAAADVDSTKFPHAAEYDAATLKNTMMTVAHRHAAEQREAGISQFQDLTPVETLEAIEKHLEAHPHHRRAKPEAEKKPAKRPAQNAPRSLRNRQTSVKPNTKQPTTFEEKYAAAEARAHAILEGKGA